MKKRKLKLKKKTIIIFVLIILISFLFVIIKINKHNEKNIKNKVDLVSVVYNKLKEQNIDKDFIKWVDLNYNGSLKKINKLLEKNNYSESIWHDSTGYSYIVLNDLYNKKYDKLDNVKIVENSKDNSTLSFVGDVSLADNWHIIPKYDERGKGVEGILSSDILKIMRDSDLMVANSEFTVSDRGSPLANKLYTFRAKPERLTIYDEMGVDLVTLANNHVYDYGKEAFLDMLDSFKEYKIPYIGAGHDLEEAMRPYYFIVNGYKIAFLSATRAEKYIMTPEATETTEGVFRCYDPTNLINQISKVKQESDYVIALVHYGTEGSHELEQVQIDSSKQYIDAGADAVIGHHAHTLQGIEFYNDKPIIYNLGNFIFNNETIDTAIFQIILDDDGKMEYYIIPALQKDCYTDILIEGGKSRVINNMNSWSINAYIDENGKVSKKE